MPPLRLLPAVLLMLVLAGCVRDRHERLPDAQAGDTEIFDANRRDVEARLQDKLNGLEVRFSGLRMKAPAEAIAARPELARALNEGPSAVATARTLVNQLQGASRADWEAIRKQTEEAVATAETIWQEFQSGNRR